ncbi:hypothetical protein TVAG_242920 [Trichomonas vaginalis G3]|uniref:Thioredoxin domain-containing protein n=1 Tax=Trichomonas vaginalis (strain ATCC PRA-98 / G3) TaxID=412133 RepID=A2F851_TRIV3|nr:thioredoxin-like family [Trichomonas vaginalis G3]EAX98927.1 hypothetical protein TVAG_242920 [Trichomonas vaginalis G3]KAI5526696.1 thioredoxin-like family [Trichomonas vaginalis G3]|eukprot:XP_001311857.1 hypothetical protein [Trichomonas vaginalis G3]
MLLLFLIQTWFDFNRTAFYQLLSTSFDKPIFNLCYSHYCPHCVGLPEGFSNFNKTLGDRDDIYISMIDCAESHDCGIFRIHGTPTISLVMGYNVRYWPRTGERGPNGWTRFINSWIYPSLRRIYNETEFNQALEEPADGGTTFYLETPSENHSWVRIMNYFSLEYKIYNDTFVYKVNPNISKPVIYAYKSKYCYEKYSGIKFGIPLFLHKNKFGIYHRYDRYEFEGLLGGRRRNAIYIVEKDLLKSNRDALAELSKDYCHGYNIGWANVDDEDDRNILKYAKIANSDLPLLKAVNFNPVALREYKGSLGVIKNYHFLPKVITYGDIKEKAPGLYRSIILTASTCIIYAFYVLHLIFMKKDSKPNVVVGEFNV